MIYDFVAKIKNIRHKDLCNHERLDGYGRALCEKNKITFDLSYILPDAGEADDFFVKTQLSVSLMPGYHEQELEGAINSFILCAEGIAGFVGGEVGKAESFYNDSRTFSRLYS